MVERDALALALLILEVLGAPVHVAADVPHDHIQGQLIVESFGQIAHYILRNQVLTPQVLSKLLKALHPLVVREYLLDSAVVEILHLDLPGVVFEVVVVEARARVHGPLELAHPLREISPRGYVGSLVANDRWFGLSLPLQRLLRLVSFL